jgi:hypothetical protein
LEVARQTSRNALKGQTAKKKSEGQQTSCSIIERNGHIKAPPPHTLQKKKKTL